MEEGGVCGRGGSRDEKWMVVSSRGGCSWKGSLDASLLVSQPPHFNLCKLPHSSQKVASRLRTERRTPLPSPLPLLLKAESPWRED